MATLRELLDEREDKTKPIKVRACSWPQGEYLEISEENVSYWLNGWELYEEPRPVKKKVKWYAYATIPTLPVMEFQHSGLAYSKIQDKKPPDISGRMFNYIRLPQLDIEVEE